VVERLVKITLAHDYRDRRDDRYRSFLSLVLFWLVAPPLQPIVVGTYAVRGTWILSHLPLEGTGHI
jgi:hypothetical protein